MKAVPRRTEMSTSFNLLEEDCHSHGGSMFVGVMKAAEEDDQGEDDDEATDDVYDDKGQDVDRPIFFA